jgi:DNA uptake protein ComE-like DNA-binding protein
MSTRIKLALASAAAALLLVNAGYFPASPVPMASAQTTAAPARLNPNTATEAQLRAIPQLTPELVAAIQQGRPFATIGDFNRTISGKLSPEQTRELYTVLFVPINLNRASQSDIMLIPGMTARMAHEFEEYRPYRDINQFNREIGKYVDANEVARLRSYVTLN